MKTIIGIDPGASGGIAWRTFEDSYAFGAVAMPATEGDIVDLLRTIACTNPDKVCFIEEVGGFVGGKGNTGSSMFKFGFSAGLLRGAAMAFGFKVHLVRPQKWQKHFSLGTTRSCESRGDWKNKLKAEAQRRWPQLKPTLSTADAILIMDYGIHTLNNE